MKVLMVEPGYAPYETELEGLEQMQTAVGGYIDAIHPYEDRVAIVCNDEGLIQGSDFNRSVPGGYGGVFGPFFVCGLAEDDFCSLTPEQMERFKKEFSKAEVLITAQGNNLITMKVPPKAKVPSDKKPEHQKNTPGQDR